MGSMFNQRALQHTQAIQPTQLSSSADLARIALNRYREQTSVGQQVVRQARRLQNEDLSSLSWCEAKNVLEDSLLQLQKKLQSEQNSLDKTAQHVQLIHLKDWIS